MDNRLRQGLRHGRRGGGEGGGQTQQQGLQPGAVARPFTEDMAAMLHIGPLLQCHEH